MASAVTELAPLDAMVLATLPDSDRRCWLTTRGVQRRLDNVGGEVARSLERLRSCGLAQADAGCPLRFARTELGERVLEQARTGAA